jgi:hypothetical protein
MPEKCNAAHCQQQGEHWDRVVIGRNEAPLPSEY